MFRAPLYQMEQLKVPREFLEGHAWHTYMAESDALGVKLGFTHNVNGRATYVDGTMLALDFMRAPVLEFQEIFARQLKKPVGRVYTMIDAIKAIESF